MRIQFRDFLRKLEGYIDDIDEDDLKSIDIFRAFLNTTLKLYVNVEIVVKIMCDAATCMSGRYSSAKQSCV